MFLPTTRFQTVKPHLNGLISTRNSDKLWPTCQALTRPLVKLKTAVKHSPTCHQALANLPSSSHKMPLQMMNNCPHEKQVFLSTSVMAGIDCQAASGDCTIAGGGVVGLDHSGDNDHWASLHRVVIGGVTGTGLDGLEARSGQRRLSIDISSIAWTTALSL